MKSDKDFSFPTRNYVDKMINSKPDLVILTTPNNPTGKTIPDKDLIKVLDKLPNKSIAVIDRTLTNTKSKISTNLLLKKYNAKNVVVLHSFSKTYGLSHERIGFAVTSNIKLADFLKQFVVLGLNVHAMKSAINVMKKSSLLKNKIKNIIKSHKILTKFSQETGIKYYPSCSDYALLKLPNNLNSVEVCNFMKKREISMMGGHEFDKIQGLNKKYIRIYIAEPKRLKRFIALLRKLNLNILK